MEHDPTPGARRRTQHLRVPVFADEKALIESQAQRAGMSVARFLREVGQGYRIDGVVDYEQVRELARMLAGQEESTHAAAHAQELLDLAALERTDSSHATGERRT